MVVIDSDGVLDIDDLTEDLQAATGTAPAADKSPGSDALSARASRTIEKHYITETLKLTGGNREEAARTARHRRAHALSPALGAVGVFIVSLASRTRASASRVPDERQSRRHGAREAR